MAGGAVASLFALAACADAQVQGAGGDDTIGAGGLVDLPTTGETGGEPAGAAGGDKDGGSPDSVTEPSTDSTSTPDPEPGDEPEAPEPGEFLHGCDSPDQCFSGYCVDSPEGPICSKTCDSGDSCPSGWSCSQVATAGDPTFICVPNDTFLCRPCQDDDDCNIPGYPATGVCVEAGTAGRFCTRKCDAEYASCPEQLTCTPHKPYGEDGPTLDLCMADSTDVCDCTPKFVAENAKTTCYREDEFGNRCYGDTICLEVGPMPACNAPDPTLETCNGVDDDCDGQTDEEAIDCITYFQDADGDGFGLGTLGDCLCEQPGPKWIELGGDCNEQVTSVNPSAEEWCNKFDDDCDGIVDEEGAADCVVQYKDEDKDGFGKGDESACFCAEKEGWSVESGDCNDLNPLQSPGHEEACDGVDNDCDGFVDEEGSGGCDPFWLDFDGDGFGLTQKSKCFCGPTGAYLASKPNDCNDDSANINPGVIELCNLIDDNCDGDTDEGEPTSMCPQVAQGSAGCVEGSCSLLGCEDGWSDADGDPLNGCECPLGQLEQPGGPGNACTVPQELGNLVDSGTEVQVQDNISPQGDEDWYRVTAVDGADPQSCDSFDLRVSFIHNPQQQFAFDVYEGDCANVVCVESFEYDKTTHLNTVIGDQPVGECPCKPGDETEDGFQQCTDQTSAYLIRVYRRPGLAPSCAAYTLRIANGL